MAEFDFEDEPAPSRREPRRREVGHGRSAFSTMLGGSLGCFAAVILVVTMICGGCVGLYFMGQQTKPATDNGAPAEPKKK